MKLERIKIEGYRSLKSVEWKPSALNVLIGANASGKSNFLEALELLPAAAEGELKNLILRRGGMYPLLWENEAERIRLDASFFDPAQTPRSISTEKDWNTYTLQLNRLATSAMYEVGIEQLVGGSGNVHLDRVFADVADALAGTETILSSRFGASEHAIPSRLQQTLRSWTVHQHLRTDPDSEVRASAITRSEERLENSGQNLVSVLFTLYNGNRVFEETTDRAMAVAFPNDYEKLKFTPLEDGRVWLRAVWKNANRRPTAADLSDGTLRFLMLIAALASPNRADVIAIDEPEAGLHPGMLPIVAELAQEAATRSQVIFSTHSPEFLDAFEQEDLPATTVFEWQKNQTVIRTIEGDELKKWVDDYSLGRFAFSGEAEALL